MKRLLTLKSFIAVAILILTIFSCKKISRYMSKGEIIGYGAKMCPCCGGTEITIDNFQNPNGNGYLLIGSLPSNFTIVNNTNFP